MREDFEHWWDQEGQYSELCGKELCLIAWSNGEYKAQKELTDDEIMDYVEAFSIDMGNVYEFQSDNVLQMIRAILDKAQEK